MNLTYLNYNNYFDRIIKKEETYSNYIIQPNVYSQVFNGINFPETDGIEMVITTEWPVTLSWLPNYLLVTHTSSVTEIIDSRWFILEMSRLSKNKYKVTLRRDVIVDNWEAIKHSPAFIEKGIITDVNNDLIFNEENNTFNEILTHREAIKDTSDMAYVVGYVPRNAFAENTNITVPVYHDSDADYSYPSLESWPYYNLITPTGDPDNVVKGYPSNVTYTCRYEAYEDRSFNHNSYLIEAVHDMSGNLKSSAQIKSASSGHLSDALRKTYTSAPPYPAINCMQYVSMSTLNNNFVNDFGFISASKTATIKTLNNKVLRIHPTSGADTFYKIVVETISPGTTHSASMAYYCPTAFRYWRNVLNSSSPLTVLDMTDPPSPAIWTGALTVQYNSAEYVIRLQQVNTSVSCTLNSNRYHLQDQPYDMFCIPYADNKRYYVGTGSSRTAFYSRKDIAVTMASAIAAQSGSGNIYDVQIVPYCPIRYALVDSGSDIGLINAGDATVNFIMENNVKVGAIFWATESSFSFDISPSNIAPLLTLNSPTAKDLKINNCTKKYRLVDPSYNQFFDFSLAKNNGYVESLHIDCCYKPFTPYVHVAPKFERMYGFNGNSPRGLVCGGNFSLPITTSAWADYELANKNYKEMFNRQLANIDVHNKYEAKKDIVNAITGTATGAASGAVTGGMAGGGAGAAAGAVIGGAASAVGGVMDIGINKALRAEDRSYQVDMYEFQLGNVKALPEGLTQVGAITPNNSIFPMLEVYECSESELEAFENQIKYNGMTIMAIQNLDSYMVGLSNYLKCKPIRLQGVPEAHTAIEIYNEFNKGVFI